ncbi:MAG TPA: DUF2461 domain-containing protein [Paludibacteraceae bacterium]|nr:DUF2461 domain-containing protein [Paludibacteraceae bacterium]HQF50102.1 DUF2461 domain-containing protein [Paludibacteraceae bacterium]HQJ90296.1 DUF2461 domain-containing protein [Paludibacteraceae bacterium]
MAVKQTLEFLTNLSENNNREWFNAHKNWYQEEKDDFERLVTDLIGRVAEFDERVKYLKPSDCIYRIYRDVRFLSDKSPYKRHFAAYVCPEGGRRSKLAGYYLHLEPDNVMLSGGVYMLEPDMLKKVRMSVYANYDELETILKNPDFVKYYNGKMVASESLKKVPAGFSPDFEGLEYLKFKNFMVEHHLSDKKASEIDLVSYAADAFKAQYDFNQFFNYTIENE